MGAILDSISTLQTRLVDIALVHLGIHSYFFTDLKDLPLRLSLALRQFMDMGLSLITKKTSLSFLDGIFPNTSKKNNAKN